MFKQLQKILNKLNYGNLVLFLLVLATFIFFGLGVITVQSCGLIILLLLCFILLFRMIDEHRKYSPGCHLRHFTKLDNTATYLETMPRFHDNRPESPHGILLLHGFSASTSEFKQLCPALDKAGILYYAPTLSGFGNESPIELKTIKAEAWIRDAERAYNLVSAMSEKVSIVAHSMGSMLAIYLAGKYPVENMILTSPYLESKKAHKFLEKMLRLPVISGIFMFLNPIVTKSSLADLESVAQTGRFVYSSVPVQAISELWRLSGLVRYEKASAATWLLLLGDRDTTIEHDATIRRLTTVCPGIKIIRYGASGHNLMEDVEQEQVISEIIERINGDIL